MPRLGRSFPVRPRPQRGPLSSLNFVPRISPHRGNRPRQPLSRTRARALWLVAAALVPASGLPTLVADAAWSTDPLATPSWDPIPRCRALKVTGNHRSAALGRFDAGVIVAAFGNRDRSLEPLYAGGANYPNVKLRKRVRFRAVAHAGTGTTYPVAVGFVEKVEPTYPKDWKDAASTLTASDAFRLFAGAGLVQPYVVEVLKDAPSMYYRLLEAQSAVGVTIAADVSGNGKNATYSGSGVTYQIASPIADSTAKAITFDGAVGMLTIPAQLGAGDFSIETWFMATAPLVNGQEIMAGDNTAGALFPQWNLFMADDGTLALDFFSGGVFAHFVTSVSYADGGWHHVVITRTAANLVAWYIDGVAPNPAATFPGATFTGAIYVGFAPGLSVANPINIAEPAIYSTILSSVRVAAHYAARTGWLGDSSDARIGRILDQLSWPSSDRDLDAGVAALGAADELASQKALDHFRLVDATEGGCLTMSRDGKVMMRNRHSIQTGPTRNTVSQATFGDQGGTEIGYTALGMAFDDVELANRVTVTRRNGITAVVFDQAQITASGTVQDHAESSISNSDIDATARAQWLLALLKNPNRWRFETIVVPLTDSNQDTVLGLEKWDRVTVAFTPPVSGARLIQDVLIIGIDHDVKVGHWDVTFHTSGTDLQLTPFILNASLLDGADAMVF